MIRKTSLFIIMGALALSLAAAETAQLKSFPELLAALNAGGRVRLVVFYVKCRLVADGRETPAPEAVGGMDLATYEYFGRKAIGNEKAFVSTSQAVLVKHARYGYITDYVKFNIFEDDSVKITVQYLAPGTLEVKMDETFLTSINDGKNEGGLFLFLDQ